MYWNYKPVTLDEIIAIPKKEQGTLEDNYGDVLIYAIKGALNMPGNTLDVVYFFITNNLQVVDQTTQEHIKQYVWECETKVSNKLL